MILEIEQRQDWMRARRQRRKQARQARVRRQAIRYSSLLMVLIAALCGFHFTPWCLSDPNRDICVHGNQAVSIAQVRGTLLNSIGKPLYRLSPKLLESQVCSLEAVKHAFVRRYLWPRPHLEVNIMEEFPWATYSSHPEHQPEAVIAESGRMISINQFPQVLKPSLMIYGPSDLKLSSGDVRHWADWLLSVRAETGQPIEYIDMRMLQDVRLQAGPYYLKLGSPDHSLSKRLSRLASVLPNIEPMKENVDYIDLSLDSNVPVRIAQGKDTGKTAKPVPGGRAATLLAGFNPLHM